MKAIICDESEDAKKLKAAYDILAMPQIHDGYTGYKPAAGISFHSKEMYEKLG